MKIMLISGSIGKKSCTRTMLDYLENDLSERGVSTEYWDLGERPLPIAIPEYHNRPMDHPDREIIEFVTKVKDADGLILGSPLYHGSFSGVLKNALDNLPSDAFMNKPVALVSHSSNARSCVRPANDLRPIVGSLGGYPGRIPIGTTDADYQPTASGYELIDSNVKQRVDELLDELVMLASKLKS